MIVFFYHMKMKWPKTLVQQWFQRYPPFSVKIRTDVWTAKSIWYE